MRWRWPTVDHRGSWRLTALTAISAVVVVDDNLICSAAGRRRGPSQHQYFSTDLHRVDRTTRLLATNAHDADSQNYQPSDALLLIDERR
jgi:hypothetical protein